MTHWMRYSAGGATGFGTLDGETITEHAGDMFDSPKPTGRTLKLSEVEVLPPSEPTKVIALWNNFHALAAKLNVAEPPEPLYLMKANTSIAAPGATVPRPAAYAGKVVYEGELGIVIGRRCTNASEQEAADAIFGYTCVNDITAADIIAKDPTFPQWVRAKSFDSFGPFGPVIATVGGRSARGRCTWPCQPSGTSITRSSRLGSGTRNSAARTGRARDSATSAAAVLSMGDLGAAEG